MIKLPKSVKLIECLLYEGSASGEPSSLMTIEDYWEDTTNMLGRPILKGKISVEILGQQYTATKVMKGNGEFLLKFDIARTGRSLIKPFSFETPVHRSKHSTPIPESIALSLGVPETFINKTTDGNGVDKSWYYLGAHPLDESLEESSSEESLDESLDESGPFISTPSDLPISGSGLTATQHQLTSDGLPKAEPHPNDQDGGSEDEWRKKVIASYPNTLVKFSGKTSNGSTTVTATSTIRDTWKMTSSTVNAGTLTRAGAIP